jgi:hypothetical protein
VFPFLSAELDLEIHEPVLLHPDKFLEVTFLIKNLPQFLLRGGKAAFEILDPILIGGNSAEEGLPLNFQYLESLIEILLLPLEKFGEGLVVDFIAVLILSLQFELMNGLLELHLVVQQFLDLLHAVFNHDFQLLLLELQDLHFPVGVVL